MDILKKYWLGIMCGVVALIALLAAVIWPLPGYVSTLQSDLDKRKAANQALFDLKNRSRSLPALDINNAETQPLEQFPNPAIIARGEEVTKQVKQESEKMLAAAVAMNTHELLVPGSLPDPPDQLRYEFREAYKKALERIISPDLLNAGTPPTANQVKAAEDELWDREFKDQIFILNGVEANRKEVDEKFNEAKAKIPDQLRSAVARAKTVYARPSVVTAVPGVLGVGVPPDPRTMWFAQLHLWMQEDIARALAEANAGKPIVEAPVKHLVELGIAAPPQYVGARPTPSGAAMGMGTEDGNGAPAAADPNAAAPKSFNVSPTGRVSNPLYDVVHFKLVLDVDAAQLPFVLQSLTNNRLIYPFHVDVVPVEAVKLLADGYDYGPSPVVRLSVDCEMLFLRKWSEPLMPVTVKRMLGIPIAQTPVAGG